jgi:hypothetical protein
VRSDPLERLKVVLEQSPDLYEEIKALIDDLNEEINDLEIEIDLASGNRKRPRKKFDDDV